MAQWTGDNGGNLEVMQTFGAHHCAESFIDMYVCSLLCSFVSVLKLWVEAL
jgi:hypothetical protein